MRRALLLRNLSLYTRNHLQSRRLPPPIFKLNPSNNNRINSSTFIITAPLLSKFRFFSSQNENNTNDSSPETPNPETSSDSSVKKQEDKALVEASLMKSDTKQLSAADIQDVDNKELKVQIEKYFKGDEEVLPDIFEAILKRKLTGKHEETDDELLDELQMEPIDDVKDDEFESDFEEAHETDEEIDNLYNVMDTVKHRMVQDESFNMNDKKWDAMVEEGIRQGFIKDTQECKDILEDMLNWDKLLPDEIKRKVDKKFNEIAAMIASGEIEDEKGYELFREYEDKMVLECAKLMEAEGPPQFDQTQPDKRKDKDDPPGEGPILRWQSRVVFAPGGDAWHPKNRKVKMGVTVKELGLSKHQFRRLRELVGKRYHPGKDELMITSERFEHREENRKDCLRTLYALLEEAGKADKLVEEARTSYVKERLRANPQFMERLHAKTMRTGRFSSLPA